MLLDRPREERGHGRGIGLALRGMRTAPHCKQEGRDRRQEAPVVVHLRLAVEPVADEIGELLRKAHRQEAVPLDHAGIAVRGLFARRAAVDERDRLAAAQEVPRRRDADDAGAEDDRIETHLSDAGFRVSGSGFQRISSAAPPCRTVTIRKPDRNT